MSDTYATTGQFGSDVQPPASTGKVDAAKHGAADLKDTATGEAKELLDTAKAEAAATVGAAKAQVKDLYAQTQHELKEQARAQQRRIAAGLRSVGDELGSMASASDGAGIARDLVQQVSTRLSGAATWLDDREPASVLTEVKRFARRRPGTFILGAVVVGVVVGRLTRALAANASDDHAGDGTGGMSADPAVPTSPAPAPQMVEPDPWAATPVETGSGVDPGAPLHEQAASSRAETQQEDGDDRLNSV